MNAVAQVVIPLCAPPSTPRRPRNAVRRSREYLTPDEVEQLMAAAHGTGRHGDRDATLILVAYRHGLRVSELVALRWDQVDLKAGTLHVTRLKNGRPSVHPIRGPELRALRPCSETMGRARTSSLRSAAGR